ncbi:N-acetyl-glucosamine-6-phosphate deacetylase [Xylographa soralifera]|nr:N-acetyl-glucosamine-6-phosphate deacetylase [Xylographa soralifera]
MKANVFSESFVPWKFHPRDVDFEPRATDRRTYITAIIIERTDTSPLDNGDKGVSGEAYTISISVTGSVLIKVVSIQGAFHALTTLSQLFYAHSEPEVDEVDVYTPFAPVEITDAPKSEHRGINLDICRNRISPKDVMRTIEAMSFNKLNRLHLHASDSQSWPLEIPALPELASKGAYHKSQIWTIPELQEVQLYGVYHEIEVYLEIDLPGHTASIAHAYPELIAAYNLQPWSLYAQEPPSGQLKLNDPAVFSFLTTLYNDLLPRTSLYASQFHVGGDEINKEVYKLDPTVNSSSTAVLRPFLQSLIDHVISSTESHSLIPIIWEDMLLEWGLDLPKSIIVQAWRSTSSLASIVAKGYKALFGPCTHWYLDCGYGTWLDPDPSNPDTPIKSPYLDWCSPYKNWREIYSYDPLVDIPEDRQHLVIGGELHLWGELTDGTNLDGMLWPRAAAGAEILWRGPYEAEEETTRRLSEMRERLVARNIGAGMVQMEWCLKNKGGCLT